MPDNLKTDYDTGMVLVIRELSHASAYFGCWFQFLQSIYRKTQEFPINYDYKTDKKLQDIARNFSVTRIHLLMRWI